MTTGDSILRDKRTRDREGERSRAETDSSCDCCCTEQPYRPSRTSPPNVSPVRTTLGSRQDPLGPPGKQITTDMGGLSCHVHTHTSTALPPLALPVPGAYTSGLVVLPCLNLLPHLHGSQPVSSLHCSQGGRELPSKTNSLGLGGLCFSPDLDRQQHG